LPAIENNWTRGAARRHTTALISALGPRVLICELHVLGLLISRPVEGRRLSWPEHTAHSRLGGCGGVVTVDEVE